MNRSKITVTVINCITALVCCVSVAVAGMTITNRICENQKSIAEVSANGSSASQSGLSSDESSGASGTEGSGSGDSADVNTDSGSADTSDGENSQGAEQQSGSGSNSGSASASSSTAAKNITATSGLQSTNKSEVLKYYKLVAKVNEKNTCKTQMKLVELTGGSGFVGSVISSFKPIAESALAKNSNEWQGIAGDPQKIKESDWKSATAVNDGTYTTLNIKVVNQTDGPNGKTHEGSVGRSMSVLDGVQAAINEMNGVSADFENGKVSLVYDNAYIKVKIKNSTGEFVKGTCEWHYRVNVNLDDLSVKVIGIPAHLKGAKGIVDYTVTY